MATIILRSIIVYFIILFVFRLLGKRELGQMQPFDLILTLILADLGTIPMAELNVPLLHGIIPLITLVIIHYLLTALTKFSPKLGKFISGKPIIVINDNGIDYSSLKKLNISVEDLFESLRCQGYFNLDNILYAIMETNGKLSVLEKIECSPVTIKDQNIKKEENNIPVSLVANGKFIEDNMLSLKINKTKLLSFLKDKKLTLKNTLVLTYTKDGKIYYQEKYKKYKNYFADLNNEVKK